MNWTAACHQVTRLGFIDAGERDRLLADDLRRGELLESGERLAVVSRPCRQAAATAAAYCGGTPGGSSSPGTVELRTA